MKKYTVQPGDTLGGIAKKFYGNVLKYKEIAQANDIENPDIINIGQVLVLPGIEEENADASKAAEAASAVTQTEGELTVEQLKAIMPKATDADLDKYITPLNELMPKYEINTPLRTAHYIAQLAHESASFKYNEENLNYSAKALRAVFGKYFKTDKMAEEYARKPEAIANIVYADRMGNGDTASGDGWKFRGRGLIQLTGHDNYEACGKDNGLDLVDNPDPLAKDPFIAVTGAGWYWQSRGLNKYADQDDVKKITKLINGGYNGLEDREEFLERAKKVLLG